MSGGKILYFYEIVSINVYNSSTCTSSFPLPEGTLTQILNTLGIISYFLVQEHLNHTHSLVRSNIIWAA